MSIKKICWHSRGSNQFLFNGKMRLLDSGPGTSVSTSTPACFLAGAVISQLVGQILLKRSPSSRDLPRICRKPGLDPWTCQLLKTRWIFYYKSERWSNETNPQWVKSGGQRKKRCRCYHCVCVHMLSYFQLFCNPMDCSRPGSSCPWDFPGKNTGVGCHFLLQGIFLIQGTEPMSLLSPALAGKFFTTRDTWEVLDGVMEHY